MNKLILSLAVGAVIAGGNPVMAEEDGVLEKASKVMKVAGSAATMIDAALSIAGKDGSNIGYADIGQRANLTATDVVNASTVQLNTLIANSSNIAVLTVDQVVDINNVVIDASELTANTILIDASNAGAILIEQMFAMLGGSVERSTLTVNTVKIGK